MAAREKDARDQAADAGAAQRVLETDVTLSRSVIWRMQEEFYVRRGLKAWTEDMVPSYITSNPFIAEIYAQIVFGYLTDCTEQSAKDVPLSPENPLRILELGAGTGKFSCLFLRKITRLLQEKNILPQTISYCMADCSEELLAHWRANPSLGEFIEMGILEFKLVRAEETQPSPQKKSPLVVIANYVFDSLPQDAFVIADGKISEALVTTTGASADLNAGPVGSLGRTFKTTPITTSRYPNKIWNSILEHYRANVSATVFFPVGALTLLKQLAHASDGRMMVLAADKGFIREDQLALMQGPPAFEFHAGNQCFSQKVNFDALARYYWSNGGEVFLPHKHFSNLHICAFIQHRSGDAFPAARKAYDLAMAGFGPDDLFALMSWLNSHLEETSIVQALALLRLTHWDATAFLRLFPVIAPQLRNVAGERLDLRHAVLSTWENRYPLTPEENALAFHCGVVLLELRFFAEALGMFKRSEQQLGRTASTSFNLGLCAMGLGHTAEALHNMTDACNLDPAFEPAKISRLKLEQELAQK